MVVSCQNEANTGQNDRGLIKLPMSLADCSKQQIWTTYLWYVLSVSYQRIQVGDVMNFPGCW